ncbi:MAG: hypothetical protein KBT06_08535 [Prevotellaceae bacterium]|nr:hypothetical protein [Candidatus Colivivens equi]
MKKSISLFFIFLFSVTMIFAKDEKIKFGKYCIYEGAIEKIEKLKVPMGPGVLEFRSIEQKDVVLTRIEGVFKNNIVTEAKVIYNNGFVFSGEVEYSYSDVDNKETKDKKECLGIKFVNGTAVVPSITTFDAENVKTNDGINWDRAGKAWHDGFMTREFSEAQWHRLHIRGTHITVNLLSSSTGSSIELDLRQKQDHISYPTKLDVSYPHCIFNRAGNSYDVTYKGALTHVINGDYTIKGDMVDGTVNYNNGHTFTGKFETSDSPKTGKYTDDLGNCYEGSFEHNSEFNLNHGRLTMSNGDWYEGVFRGLASELGAASLLSGQCVGHMSEGFFEGQIISHKLGKGKLIDPTGGIWEGVWKDGSFYSGNTSIKNDTTEISGEWKDGSFYKGVSKGNVNGGQYFGEWENGRFVEGNCETKSFDFQGSLIPFTGTVHGDSLSGRFDFNDYVFDGTFASFQPIGECKYSYLSGYISGLWDNTDFLNGNFSYTDSIATYSGTIKNVKGQKVITIQEEGKPFRSLELSEINYNSFALIKTSIEERRFELKLKQILASSNQERARSLLSGNNYWGVFDPATLFGRGSQGKLVVDYINKLGAVCIDLTFLSNQKAHTRMYFDRGRKDSRFNSVDMYMMLASGGNYNPQAMDLMTELFMAPILKSLDQDEECYYSLKGDSVILYSDKTLKRFQALKLISNGTSLQWSEKYGVNKIYKQ